MIIDVTEQKSAKQRILKVIIDVTEQISLPNVKYL